MPAIEINLENLSNTIKNLNNTEIETLLLLLSDEADELLKRKKEIETGKVKPLSRDEVFDV